MQIPQPLKSYAQPTLILVADTKVAKIFVAHERQFKLLEDLKNDRLSISDVDRYKVTISQGRSSKAVDEKLKEREAKEFYKMLSKRLHTFHLSGAYEVCIIVVPHDDLPFFLTTLTVPVKERVVLSLAKQLTKVTDDNLVLFLDEARKR